MLVYTDLDMQKTVLSFSRKMCKIMKMTDFTYSTEISILYFSMTGSFIVKSLLLVSTSLFPCPAVTLTWNNCKLYLFRTVTDILAFGGNRQLKKHSFLYFSFSVFSSSLE